MTKIAQRTDSYVRYINTRENEKIESKKKGGVWQALAKTKQSKSEKKKKNEGVSDSQKT